MAHLWRCDGERWTAVELDALAADAAGGAAPVILHADGGSGGTWLLAVPAAAGVAVNGTRVATGLVALTDRDEIRLADGTRLFFSAARAAVVETCTRPLPELRCPVCCRPFEAATPIVRCPTPGCGVVHHESERLPCFSYAEECVVCQQPTAASRWTPEEL